MCYAFRLHQIQKYGSNYFIAQIKRGRFDANWNSICGNPVPVFEQRRSDVGAPAGEKTSVLSLFNLDYANNLCSILGYQQVMYYRTYEQYTSKQAVHIMHRQYSDPFWEIYPDFDCDPLSGIVGLKCLSKLFLIQLPTIA